MWSGCSENGALEGRGIFSEERHGAKGAIFRSEGYAGSGGCLAPTGAGWGKAEIAALN